MTTPGDGVSYWRCGLCGGFGWWENTEVEDDHPDRFTECSLCRGTGVVDVHQRVYELPVPETDI